MWNFYMDTDKLLCHLLVLLGYTITGQVKATSRIKGEFTCPYTSVVSISSISSISADKFLEICLYIFVGRQLV